MFSYLGKLIVWLMSLLTVRRNTLAAGNSLPLLL